MKTLELSNIETKQIFILAFRYALGRTSYVTHDISNLIILNWENFRPDERARFKKEISEAINANRAGMDIDVKSWKSIMELD